MIPDLDIYRSANVLVKQHGPDAPIQAAMRADEVFLIDKIVCDWPNDPPLATRARPALHYDWPANWNSAPMKSRSEMTPYGTVMRS